MDLIKREDAIKALTEVLFDEPPYLNSIEKCETFARNAMKDIPSAEKQGEWIFISIDLSECSECGEYGKDTMRFCPACGARMAKGADNE